MPRDRVLALQGVDWWPPAHPPVVAGIDWTVRAGEHWAVLGPNGAGKSTLLSIAGAQRYPSRGDVLVLGERIGRTDVRGLRSRIGVVDPRLRVPPRLPVLDYVLTGASGTVLALDERYDDTTRTRARELIELVGIGRLSDHEVGTCSQGELSRARIARALMNDPVLLLLDEPTSGLDLPGREHLVMTLETVARASPTRATVLVAHHLEDLPATTTNALLLRDGRALAGGGVREVLTDEQLSACFGLALAVTHHDGRWAARAAR